MAPGFVPSSYENENGEKVTVTWMQQQAIKAQYAKANLAVAKVIAMPFYKALNKSRRAKVLQSIYSAYRAGALYSALGSGYGSSNRLAILAKTGSVTVAGIIGAVSAIRSMEGNERTSRKEMAIAFVNKLPLTKNEKLLVLFLAGYGVDKNAVITAVKQKGLTHKEAIEFVNGKRKSRGKLCPRMSANVRLVSAWRYRIITTASKKVSVYRHF